MASRFEGEWVLSGVKDALPFYKHVGMSEAEIEQFKDFDVIGDVKFELSFQGKEMTSITTLKEKIVENEKLTLGVEKKVEFEGMKGSTKADLEGDVFVNWFTHDGWKDTRYESTVSGNKMTVIMMTVEKGHQGITATKEYTKQ